MRMFRIKRSWQPEVSFLGVWGVASLAAFLFMPPTWAAQAQDVSDESLRLRMQQLSDAIAKTQAQVSESQRQLEEMKQQLIDLQREMTQGHSTSTAPPAASTQQSALSSSEAISESMKDAIQDLRERQAVTESEIATHDQDKVESESKYPVRISGMLLLNGFVNRGAVDMPAVPSVALSGSGNAGASVKQTLLGIDAQGPHLFGAASYADLRIDFYGSSASTTSAGNYSGYLNNSALLRLRTMHAGLTWNHAQAFFALDRPILSPEKPDSLAATAEPPLAWSGNLWTWNPQAGVTANLGRSVSRGVQFQAALIDTGDAPLTSYAPSSNALVIPPSGAEQSSRPGVEVRLAGLGTLRDRDRNHLGVGGYFAPHQSSLGISYDSWAAIVDERLLLPANLQLTGSFYRGRALGGLGGGGYKDFAYAPNSYTGGYYFRALDDVGGWAQLKKRVNERLEFNGAAGMDNVFAGQFRPYFVQGASMMQNLARNHTYAGNVIYSPSAYLLFSLEYRWLESTPVTGASAQSNIIGVAAGYKF